MIRSSGPADSFFDTSQHAMHKSCPWSWKRRFSIAWSQTSQVSPFGNANGSLARKESPVLLTEDMRSQRQRHEHLFGEPLLVTSAKHF